MKLKRLQKQQMAGCTWPCLCWGVCGPALPPPSRHPFPPGAQEMEGGVAGEATGIHLIWGCFCLASSARDNFVIVTSSDSLKALLEGQILRAASGIWRGGAHNLLWSQRRALRRALESGYRVAVLLIFWGPNTVR
ncbi:unnamed protein product [Rangifer tarandus platyrhynchus]|uniref:Uncharacterized protein n=1 Tax=Rangifer tarandus platyrhynchus TaxID=3082113 RepID=A0AC59ZZF2_RANTA